MNRDDRIAGFEFAASPIPTGHGLASLGVLCLALSPISEAATGTSLAVPPSGKTGFTRIETSTSGIAFTNRISDIQISINRLLEDGAGVAAGDVDGDGLCDLYFCGLESHNALYRNLGDWRFEDVTSASGVACEGQLSTGSVLADLDGDGDLDLLVNALGKGTRQFVNDGKGRFQEAAQSGLVQRFGSRTLALADVDGDGDLDLYVTNYRTTTARDAPVTVKVKQVGGRWEVPPEHRDRFVAESSVNSTLALLEYGEPDFLYLNDGRGRFEAVSWTEGRFLDEAGQPLTAPPRDWGLTAMFRDLNDDGAPDLYVCNDYFTPDRIWLNQGQGRFRALPRLALRKTCYAAMAVDFGDLNRDGHDEIFVTEMLSRDHVRRQVQHSLLEMMPLPAWGWGWPDGVADTRVQVMRNTLSLNRGDGTYAEIAQYSGLEASEWTWGSILCDVDLDGFEDVLIANGHGRDLANSDALAEIDRLPKAVTPEARLKTLDLFPPMPLPHLLFRNRGDLTFEEVSHAWGFDVVGVANGMTLADLDNDGDLDVVLNNLNRAAVLLRNDSVAPRVAVRLKGGRGNTQGIGAKIRVTGGPVPQSQEAICGGRYLSAADPLRVFAAGRATNLTIEVRWPSGKRSLVAEARPNSTYLIAETDATATTPPKPAATSPWFEDRSALLQHVHHEAPFDDFGRQPLLVRRLSALGPGVAWCDLNGDGADDLVIGSGRGGTLRVLLNNGGGGFGAIAAPAWATPAPDDLTGMAVWSNEPGSTSLLVGLANYETGDPKGAAVLRYDVFFGAIQNTVAVPGDTSSVGPIAIADLEGDGDLDLFVGGRVMGGRYPAAAGSRIYRCVEGKFVLDPQNTEFLAAAGLVSGAVWSDLTGDGLPELVLATEWGPVRLFRNDRGQLKAWDPPVERLGDDGTPPSGRALTLSRLTGWWTGVTTGDFDGDGRLDLVVGNWGLNCKYRAHLDDEVRVYHGDLDANEVWDAIEAYWEPALKKVVPWCDRKTMRAAIPIVGERFHSYLEYGRASVEEVCGDGFARLSELRANTLQSMVFLNREGGFAAQPLPLEAQLSPVFAVCVGDHEGDGYEDVFLGQNFFGTDLETGRYDAGRGLWLRGDGRGGFTAVPGHESGVIVYGEQRGAALADYDGDGRVDLVVCQNAAETKLYRNARGKPGLRIRLAGAPGNASGIGSVIQLNREGRWGPARELHGGSGFWSQDSAAPVMSCTSGDPTEIRVRWAAGGMVTARVPAGAREIQVRPDGRLEVLR